MKFNNVCASISFGPVDVQNVIYGSASAQSSEFRVCAWGEVVSQPVYVLQIVQIQQSADHRKQRFSIVIVTCVIVNRHGSHPVCQYYKLHGIISTQTHNLTFSA